MKELVSMKRYCGDRGRFCDTSFMTDRNYREAIRSSLSASLNHILFF